MGKPSTPQVDPEVSRGMLANQSALVDIAKGQAAHGDVLFNLTEPGLQIAEDKYQRLQSGDPAAILQAIAPTAEASSEAAAGAKSNIMANAPAGGEKNLALEAVEANKGATVAKAVSGATGGAVPALAQIAGQGVGESVAAAGTAVSGYSAGSQTLGSLGNMDLEAQKMQAEQKGNILGSITGLAQTGAEMAMMFA